MSSVIVSQCFPTTVCLRNRAKKIKTHNPILTQFKSMFLVNAESFSAISSIVSKEHFRVEAKFDFLGGGVHIKRSKHNAQPILLITPPNALHLHEEERNSSVRKCNGRTREVK